MKYHDNRELLLTFLTKIPPVPPHVVTEKKEHFDFLLHSYQRQRCASYTGGLGMMQDMSVISTISYDRRSRSSVSSYGRRESVFTNSDWGSASPPGRGSTSTQGRGSTSRPPTEIDLVYIQSITNHQIDKWKNLFDRMSNKRNPSFRLAVETQGKEPFLLPDSPRSNLFHNMVRKVAKHYLTEDVERQYYADKYTCCPPPLFIPFITITEVGFFIYHCLEANSVSHSGPVPVQSILIYRPDRRLELWRFILYMFIHAGWVHLFFNMLVQIIVGIPLEMVHGSFRITFVYLAGVLAGSLGTSVFDIHVYLVGASGGVYALLAAHLANVMLNYTNMEFGIVKLAAILVIASADVGFAVWDRYSSTDSVPPVSYTAHLMGSLAGLTMGLVVLKNFEQKLHEQYIWWISLLIYLVCFAFAVCWNIFYY